MAFVPPIIYTIDYSMFSGAVATQTIDIGWLTEDEYVAFLAGRVNANFVGKHIVPAMLEIGIAGTLNAFGQAPVHAGGIPRAIFHRATERGVGLTTGRHPGYGVPGGGSWVLKATLTLDGGLVSDLTAGSIKLSAQTGRTFL